MIPLPLMILSMALQTFSAISEAKAQRQTHNLQAQSIDRERQREEQIGKLKASQEREKNKRMLATQANLMSGRGGDVGTASNLLLVGDTAEQAELNARLIEQGYEHKVVQMGDEIRLAGMRGENAYRSGLMKAGTALLKGSMKIADQY